MASLLNDCDKLWGTRHADSARWMFRTLLYKDELPADEQAHYALMLAEMDREVDTCQFRNDSLLDVALEYYDNSDNLLMVRALLGKAAIQESFGSKESALANYREALRILQKHPDAVRLLYHAYTGIAEAHEQAKEFALMKETYQQACCDTRRMEGDSALLRHYRAHLYSGLGRAYLALQQPDSALYYHRKAIGLHVPGATCPAIYLYAGEALFLTEHYHDCLHLLRTLATEWKETPEEEEEMLDEPEEDRAACYYYMGLCHLQCGATDSATHYLLRSCEEGKIETKAEAYQTLYTLYSEKGDYRRANTYLMRYELFADSLVMADYAAEERNRNYRYRSYKAQRKAYFKEKRLRRQAIAGGCVLAFCLIIGYQYKLRKKQIEKLQYQNRTERMEADLDKMQQYIGKLNDTIRRLRNKQSDWEQELQLIEEEREQARKEQQRMQQVFFEQMPIYADMARLLKQKTSAKKEKLALSAVQRKALHDTLTRLLPEETAEMAAHHPGLSNEDMDMLCLRRFGFTFAQIALCFGYADPQVLIQRNHRLKKQLTAQA